MGRMIDRSAKRPERMRRVIQRLGPWTKVFPAGTASPIACKHDKHTRFVAVVAYVESGTTHDELNPRVQHTDDDTITLIFGGVLANNTRVVIGRLV